MTGASPEALETFSVPGSTFKTMIQTLTVSRSAPCFNEGGELETANEVFSLLHAMVVELTGIEPVTPCLQSRCSPS